MLKFLWLLERGMSFLCSSAASESRKLCSLLLSKLFMSLLLFSWLVVCRIVWLIL